MGAIRRVGRGEEDGWAECLSVGRLSKVDQGSDF